MQQFQKQDAASMVMPPEAAVQNSWHLYMVEAAFPQTAMYLPHILQSAAVLVGYDIPSCYLTIFT